MKVRHLCAVLGVAIAVGTVTFMSSLVATNDRQATAVAERLLKAVPVAAEAKVAQLALDFRRDRLAAGGDLADGGDERVVVRRLDDCSACARRKRVEEADLSLAIDDLLQHQEARNNHRKPIGFAE